MEGNHGRRRHAFEAEHGVAPLHAGSTRSLKVEESHVGKCAWRMRPELHDDYVVKSEGDSEGNGNEPITKL